ncbi:hypothetical protein GVAV_002879 [Gurleya vavrai]
MVSKKFYKNHIKPEAPAQSNLGSPNPNDNLSARTKLETKLRGEQIELSNSKVQNRDTDGNIKLKKKLSERECRRMLYIIEGEDGFDGMTTRGMISRLAKYGDREFQEWFIDVAASNEIGTTCDEIKNNIVRYCIESSIHDIVMFRDEKYSNFLDRCRNFCCDYKD